MDLMRAGDPARLMRWSRWGILSTAILMGSAMMFSALSNHSRIQAISETLVRGQGQLLVAGVQQSLFAVGRRMEAEDVARVLAAFEGQGMRYLAMPFPTLREAGTAVGGPPTVVPVNPGEPPELLVTDIGERIRLIWRAPAPPPRPPPQGQEPFGGPTVRGEGQPPGGGFRPGGPPGPEGPPGGPGGGPGGPRGRPRDTPMVIEFEPLTIRELASSARRSLILSGIVSAAMLLAALVAFRWLKRREALQHKLERERHLATLGEMSAVLAHELRNPLASLKGHAQLLAEALPEGRSRTKAERVVKEALRMEDLTASLLAFVRTGTIQRQAADPVAIVRAAAEEVDPRRIELDTQAAPAHWQLDAARMQQVLSNLLRNAVQASPAGASVFARVAAEPNALLYEVRDVGTGIPPGQEALIFEPFHTQRPLGNGLGLAVARRVVELHGGSIQASNHPEGGALFRVRIPVSA
jgi:two-component system sensor histidine kinase HydH